MTYMEKEAQEAYEKGFMQRVAESDRLKARLALLTLALGGAGLVAAAGKRSPGFAEALGRITDATQGAILGGGIPASATLLGALAARNRGVTLPPAAVQAGLGLSALGGIAGGRYGYNKGIERRRKERDQRESAKSPQGADIAAEDEEKEAQEAYEQGFISKVLEKTAFISGSGIANSLVGSLVAENVDEEQGQAAAAETESAPDIDEMVSNIALSAEDDAAREYLQANEERIREILRQVL